MKRREQKLVYEHFIQIRKSKANICFDISFFNVFANINLFHIIVNIVYKQIGKISFYPHSDLNLKYSHISTIL